MTRELGKIAALAADIFELTWKSAQDSRVFHDALGTVNEVLSLDATGKLDERLTGHQQNVLIEASDVLQQLRDTAEADRG